MSDIEKTSQYKEIGIIEILHMMVINKKPILAFTIPIAIIAVVYALIIPQYWKSTTTISPIVSGNEGMSLNLGLMDMLGGGVMSNGKEDMAIEFVSIMHSRTFKEEVIRKFDLVKYFEITHPNPDVVLELALKKIDKAVSLVVDEETFFVYITVETKDKLLSRDIANYYIKALEDYNQYTKTTKSRLKRMFLEKRVDELKSQIDSLSVVLRDFQLKNNVIAPDQQTQALISMYAELTTKQLENDIEMQLASQTYDVNSPILIRLKTQREYLKGKMEELETNTNTQSFKFIPKISDVPDITKDYAHILMNFEIQKKVFEYVYPQYESAKIEELRDLPTLEVIDKANIAGLRSKPKRGIMVVIITFIAFLLSSLVIIIKESLNANQKELFLAIFRNILNFKRQQA